MKKTINLFSRVLCALMLCVGLVVTGCYDDSSLLGQIGELDSRVTELERLVAQHNTNIESLQTIVTALQERDYVTGVAPIKEGDEIIGYTITFSKSGAVTIHNGKGDYAPVMGVKQDKDGQWYWTVDGEWMTDSEGKKVRASAIDGEDGDKGETGVTPQLKIMDGYWYVSYDGGKTWEDEPLGQATGGNGDTMFTEVSYDDDYLYITMADGTKLTLPRASSNQGEGGEGEGGQGNPDAENTQSVSKGPITLVLENVTATIVTFAAQLDVDMMADYQEVGLIYSLHNELDIESENVVSIKINREQYSETFTELPYNTKYYYTVYLLRNGVYSYGETKEFTTADVVPSVSVVESSVTATTASFSGTVTGLSEIDKSSIQVGMAYSSVSGDFQNNENIKVGIDPTSEDYSYSISLENLSYGTKYYYCTYVKLNGIYKYGEVKEFSTANVVPSVSVVESSITATASFSGTVTGLSEIDKSSIQVGMAYSSVSGDFQNNENIKVASGEISEEGTYSMSMKQYTYDAIKYYYCSYILQNGVYIYGEVKEFSTKGAVVDLNMSSATDLSSSESANCYIISQSGTYKFKTVKGNSSTSVGNVASCTILWESFGTSTIPYCCSLISGVCYKDNYIAFETSSTFTEGNAVIAARDASGKILWSWHIWLTDQPAEHVYNNNAGTMMDRNLGATSATPGDVGALGLLYQWGRKDPFLGSSSIHYESMELAASTLTWPSVVESTSYTGTIDYVTANPTTYVYCSSSSNESDWHYGSRDNTLWQSSKTIYDPCPSGWHVPDGGSSGLWSKAGFTFTTYDSTNEGISFSISSPSTTWYPASGCRYYYDGGLGDVCDYGYYWSVTPSSSRAYFLYFDCFGFVYPWDYYGRASGYAVRCLQE